MMAVIMDISLAFNVAMTLVSFLGGWLLKSLFDRIRALEDADRKMADAVSAIREALPTYYVRQDAFAKLGDHIFEALRRIEDKIDLKADKNNHAR